MLNAIGPVWDGNEVWLVTGGDICSFPEVYATVFGILSRLMLLLLRSCCARSRWSSGEGRSAVVARDVDAAFAFDRSARAVVGVAIGNVVRSVHGRRRRFAGTFLGS
jgi:cytochrome d ubiquinol oxidase subunit II